MKIPTALSLLGSGQLPSIGLVGLLLRPMYRGAFVAAASANGVLALLARGPVPFDDIAAALSPNPSTRDALEAWLEMGVSLGELSRTEAGYGLRGALSRRLADARVDAVAAMLVEAATLHTALLWRTPALTREGRRFTLADQDGRLIARTSRVLEPLVREAIDEALPRPGGGHLVQQRLLEVGCGSGVYIRHALERDPHMTAVGIELQPEVAAMARDNLRQWRLEGRAVVEDGDLRARPTDPTFSLVTLHNNIYYFPVESRVEVLAHARRFLRPGGRILLTTGCRGGGLAMQALDLWAAATEGCGRLPHPDELVDQLGKAGFTDARARRLMPGEAYFSFTATTP